MSVRNTRLSSFDATCTFIMTLQLLSTTEAGVAVLGESEYLYRHANVHPRLHNVWEIENAQLKGLEIFCTQCVCTSPFL